MDKDTAIERLYYLKYYETMAPVIDNEEEWMCIYRKLAEGDRPYVDYEIAYHPQQQCFMFISTHADREDTYFSLSEVSAYMSEESIDRFNEVQSRIGSEDIFMELHNDIMMSEDIPEEWKESLTKMGQVEDKFDVPNDRRLTIVNDAGVYIPAENVTINKIKDAYQGYLDTHKVVYKFEGNEYDYLQSTTYSDVEVPGLEGYTWEHFSDGSGCLLDVNREIVAGYELAHMPGAHSELHIGKEYFYFTNITFDALIKEAEGFALQQLRQKQEQSQEMTLEKRKETLLEDAETERNMNKRMENKEEPHMQTTTSNDTTTQTTPVQAASNTAPQPATESDTIKKIIISRNIVARTEADGTLVSRIPGRNQYLYLKPECILAQDEHSILAQVEQRRVYTVGSEDPTKPGTWMRGETLSEYYKYDENYDPLVKQVIRERETRTKGQSQQPNGQTGSAAAQTAPENSNTQQNNNSPQNSSTQQNGNQTQVNPRSQQRLQTPKFSKEQFWQLKLGQKHHLDISKYWNPNLSAEQMKQLRLMQENAVDIAALGYNHPSVPPEVLEELRFGHKAGYNMNQYDWRHMAPGQIREIRLGLEQGLDVKQYGFRAYSAEQMKQLRLGLQNGLDITTYRNPHFTDRQMYSMRCSQIFERIKEKLKELFESWKEFFRHSSLSQIRGAVLDKVARGMERTVEALSSKELVQGPFRNQAVPEVTLDDRIQETVQDIKELLVSQELAPEGILEDGKLSEQMNDRIRQALDELIQPENIQNMENQKQIIAESAEDVIRTAGAELPAQDMEQVSRKEQQLEAQTAEVVQDRMQVNQRAGGPDGELELQSEVPLKAQTAEPPEVKIEEAQKEPSNEWEGLSDEELFERIGEEMRLEAQAAAMDRSMDMVMEA